MSFCANCGHAIAWHRERVGACLHLFGTPDECKCDIFDEVAE